MFVRSIKHSCLPVRQTVFLIGLTIPFTSQAATTTVSGLLEAEMSFADSYTGQSSSDIVLATAELSFDAEISEWVSGHVSLLYEEDETDLEVDEGYIQYGNSFLSSFSVKAGQIYIPFGNFATNMISDPLTLEIAETRESAVIATYDSGFVVSFYIFNGDLLETSGDNVLDNFGVNLGYVYQGDSMTFDIGFGYINNFGESDTLSEVIVGNLSGNAVDYVPGFIGHFILEWGSLQFISELAAASGEFNTGEVQTFKKSQPSATNVEFGYNISDVFNVALGFQNTVDLAGVNSLPESRFLLGASYQIDEATSIAFEYAGDSDYSGNDGGSGKSASTTTIQWSTRF